MKNIFLAVICGWTFLTPLESRAITFGPFGPHGEGGTKSGAFSRGAINDNRPTGTSCLHEIQSSLPSVSLG